jgi:hypothetical protein
MLLAQNQTCRQMEWNRWSKNNPPQWQPFDFRQLPKTYLKKLITMDQIPKCLKPVEENTGKTLALQLLKK